MPAAATASGLDYDFDTEIVAPTISREGANLAYSLCGRSPRGRGRRGVPHSRDSTSSSSRPRSRTQDRCGHAPDKSALIEGARLATSAASTRKPLAATWAEAIRSTRATIALRSADSVRSQAVDGSAGKPTERIVRHLA